MRTCLAVLFCLFLKVAGGKTMYLSNKYNLKDVLATATAQASAVAHAPAYSIAGASASASASASSLINSRKSLLPSYSSIKADVDKRIADAKARMEQRRKEIFNKSYHKKVSCYDLKDDVCYAIDEYDYCGYCVTEKYPHVKGYGIEYYEETIPVVGKKHGKDEYQKVIKPKGECHGEFVYAGDYCPSCEKALQCLIVCSEVDVDASEKSGVLEIKESCFDDCGVTEKDLIACFRVSRSHQ
eukprot:TRINITY_DN302_c0_g2_i4.p2 TRINITY_DN302_c0_g2~~TRINITY_DN302_c0_g2_i4.p2  ORF type:complete len:241 (-),score=39.82 TRINITY_DN302_c0_g2_i4:75-797(-)